MGVFIFSSLFSAAVEFPAESCPTRETLIAPCCVLLLFVGGLVFFFSVGVTELVQNIFG